MIDFQYIQDKVSNKVRLEFDELVFMYNNFSLSELSLLADMVRREKNGISVLYNNNFHIEPSNICKHRCKFCSFRRESQFDEGAWDMSIEDILKYCKEKYTSGMTEVHIVGSSHPEKKLDYYLNVIKTARENLPKEVAIKAYSAVEILDMSEGVGIEETLKQLKDVGLDAIPGGGAEILDDNIRSIICPDKATTEQWLEIHRIAHKIGIHSNATMLFGHIENREDRIRHILKIRELQDQTGGFSAFIPLKYLTSNNPLSKDYNITEISTLEIMRTYAISRLALDNVQHIKAYWPMLGLSDTEISLLYGADDIDGTVNNSTKIYSLAGASEQKPSLDVQTLEEIAKSAGYKAIERNSFYN